ncbi:MULTISPECIES: enolase C-terminal domain-like protein [unclassified Roseitalea]|uniref:enolase C-terminal domain-like protein n=1 Tax=unclassified Roseitalea TaxID=2639107 RepID=UPI00273D9E10|nr:MULTISPECIES: enolase C-terminal domain-like protein [unclassified Roseitalea]
MTIASVHALALDVGFSRQALQTRRVASPMSRFPAFAERRASWMWPTKKAFVRIETQDGTVGWSCTNGGEVTALIVREHLARMVVGRPLDEIETLWEQMFLSLLPNDRSGFAMMAIAGVDIALWDARTRQTGRPLTELLGGTRREHIHAYATTPDPARLAADGWWGLKAAMPRCVQEGDVGLDENVALMEHFRKIAGPDRRIMLDAFMAWDADYTLRFAEATRDLDIFWIEDPVPPYDIAGLRRIRKAAGEGIRLALGNFCFSRFDCAPLLEEGLVDILQPDVAWAGGITETIRIIEMAEAACVPVILHNTCEQPWALALAAARQKVPIVEFVDRGETSELYGLMGDPPARRGGCVAVPAGSNTPSGRVAAAFAELTGASQ